jgi:hypothetical protein
MIRFTPDFLKRAVLSVTSFLKRICSPILQVSLPQQDILFDEVLSRIGTEVAIIPGHPHPRKPVGETDKLFTIHRCSNVRPAVADIDGDRFFYF